MDTDLDALEAAFTQFMKAMWRPKSWEAVQQIAKTDLDRPAASLLMTLADSNPDCRLHELALKMGVEAPSVTRTVQRLEQAGLVARTVDPDDRRATRIVPTRRGLAMTRSLRRAKRERLRSMLNDWSAEDRARLVQLLQRLADQASELIAPRGLPKVTLEGRKK